MQDRLKQDIANFYYFSLLNETVAVEAATKTYMEFCKGLGEKKDDAPEKSKLVHECHKGWSKFNKKAKFGGGTVLEAGWQMPEGIDFGLWKHFVRDAEEEEYVAVIWSNVLNYSDEEIARGLGVTVGTVRHRTGRGLRKLGAMWGGQQ